MTAAEAQAALAAITLDLLALEDRCREILARIPRSPNEDALYNGDMVWDRETEIRTAECVREQLRRVVESLERVSRVTDQELRRDFGPRSA